MNPFEALQISQSASLDEAKEAYHRLAKLWHPDRFSGPEKRAAEEKFRGITEAYAAIKSGDAFNAQGSAEPAQPPAEAVPVVKAPKDWLAEAKSGFAQKNYEVAISLSHFCFQFQDVAEDARMVYAMALEATGRDIKSQARAYEDVIRCNPSNRIATAKLAKLYLALNMPTKAESMAAKARALGGLHNELPPEARGGEAGGMMGKLTGFFKRG